MPKWSFTADEARDSPERPGKTEKRQVSRQRYSDYSAAVRFDSDQTDATAQSGFLTPTFGFSGNKGFRVSTAYFQTLGRSADVTFRGDIYTRARHRLRTGLAHARQFAFIFQFRILRRQRPHFRRRSERGQIPIRAVRSSMPTAFIIFQTALRRSPMCA